ncbi:MAG TPA: helix-turn-helix domain-containing protein [Candidatus Babeliales bacterium]|jgi:probable addiction module antidote protein|nr:helix-turn-helix domain-containing protein [Candidatus Babeliales bacterium]
MAKQLKEFKEYFAEKLKDLDYAIAYLNEALADEDKRVFLVALKNVIEANKESKSVLAKKTNISKPTVYRILSTTGNPRWNSITSIVDAMNLQINVSLKK